MTDSILLLVTGGRGPKECAWAVAAATAEMRSEAAGIGIAADFEPAAGTVCRSSVVSLSGPGAERFATSWTGTVAHVDPSARGRGGRRNFYVAVHRLASAPDPAEIDPQDVVYETMRAGGPGGQHQNTTDSAVRAVHRPTGLTAMARDGRSQHANKQLALDRLRGLAAGVDAVKAAEHDRSGWMSRIEVERGNPKRTLRS
jgi:peptide chain release factor